jgi:streptogrisin C
MNSLLTRIPHARRTVRLLASAGAGVLAATLAIVPAGAATPEPPYDMGPKHDPLAAIALAYLATYPDLTRERAAAAARAQLAAEAIKGLLEDRWETFGGGWFDPHTGTYRLAVTSPDTAAGLERLPEVVENPDASVEVSLVERSLEQLERLAHQVRTGDGRLTAIVGEQVGIDVATNEVVAAVPADRWDEAVALELPDGVRLVVDEETKVEPNVCLSRADCDDHLAAGLVLRREGQQVCSAGFSARTMFFNVRIQTTAGHCVDQLWLDRWQNGTTNVEHVGIVTDAVDFGPADAGRIVVQSTSPYHDDNTGRIAIGASSWVPVNGSTFLLAGDVVCLSASFHDATRPGNPCGIVTVASDPMMRGMVRIHGHSACHGDSGGGWYWLTGTGQRHAAALQSRSTPGCKTAPHLSWASPIAAFFDDLIYETG